MGYRDVAKSTPGLVTAVRLAKRSRLALKLTQSPFVTTYPPGDFYSPLPSVEEIPATEARQTTRDCPGVDLREAAQLALLDELGRYQAEIPFGDQASDGMRYFFVNDWFSYCDATVLYSLMRHFRPARIVEVGSGFSSAVMLDTSDRFFDSKTRLTFIDPYPQRLESLLRGNDRQRATVLAKKVQEVELSVFDALQANDFLFIDSSHVVKVGSDVAWLLFQILPRLSSGVIIHIHDVPWPFEYPHDWLRAGRAWNEAYFFRAFLQYNEQFEILFFNDYMKTQHPRELAGKLPLAMKEATNALTRSASSLWIRRR